MTVLTYQSSFHIPVPAAQLKTPVQGVERLTPPAPLKQPRFTRAAMAATGVFLVLVPSSELRTQTPWRTIGGLVQPWQPPHIMREKLGVMAAAGLSLILAPRSQLALSTPWRDIGGQVQSWQPPHRGVEKKAAILRGDDGIQAKYVDWEYIDWDIDVNHPPRSRNLTRLAPLIDQYNEEWQIGPAVLQTSAYAWGYDQPHNYPRRAAEKNGAILRGDDGSQGTFTAWKNVGFEIQSIQPPHFKPEQHGAILRGDEGNQGRFNYWKNAGWEIQPPQPPHPRTERAGLIQQWVNIDAALINWYSMGWAVQPHQPSHPRPEKSAVQFTGDGGIEAPLLIGLQTADYKWGYDEPYVYPRKRFAVSGAIAPREDGNEAKYVIWNYTGWEIQPPPPPHRRPEVKAASFLRGDDGNQSEYAFWWNAGWEVQPVQPPAFVRGHKGAVMKGLDGIEARFTYILSFQDPNPRRPLYRLGGGGTYWKGRNT